MQPAASSGPRERSAIERIIAEHALALVGGLFVLVAAVLFVSFAIDQGWIGPWGKFAMALALAGALVAASLRVAAKLPAEQRIGRAVGSLHGVLAGTGVGVAFIAIVAAVRVERLIEPGVGAFFEVVVAAGAVQLARTWRSQDLAAFGIGVGLAAPMLVGAEASGSTIALLSVSLVAACALAIIEAWPRLLLGAAVVTLPQLTSAIGDGANNGDPLAGGVAMALAWWGLLVVACLVCFARHPERAHRSLVSTLFVVAGGVAACLAQAADLEIDDTRAWLLLMLAMLHLAIAAVLYVRDADRWTVPIAALVGAGATVAAIAFVDATDDAAVTLAWVAEALAITVLWWRLRDRMTAVFAAGLWVATLVRFVAIDASPERLLEPAGPLAPVALAGGSIIVAAFAVRVLQPRLDHRDGIAGAFVRRASQALAIVTTWYVLGILLIDSVYSSDSTDVALLTLGAWAAFGALIGAYEHTITRYEEALVGGIAACLIELCVLPWTEHSLFALGVCVITAAAAAGLSWRASDDDRALTGWLLAAYQACVAVLLTMIVAPPMSLRATGGTERVDTSVVGATDRATIVAAVWLLVLAVVPAVVAARRRPAGVLRGCLLGLAVSGWYAISVSVVAAFTTLPGHVEQDAQVALTLTWVVLGAGALFAGTSPRLRAHVELRIGGYTLLGMAALKLVLLDTIQFSTPMRVLAFLATGLGLLGSAALEQRMRDDDRGA